MPAQRENIKFVSGSDVCAGWLYRPATPTMAGSPAVVLGHGLGAVKEMCLDRYAERFSDAGMVCVAFDYRFFGESGGEPRQLLDILAQLADWTAALDYVSTLEGVDRTCIGIFGSSFGGGHVITTAAKDKRVKAAIAQCPFTSGFASAPLVGLRPMLHLAYLGIKDVLFSSGNNIVPVQLAGHPGETALMNAPYAYDAAQKLIPKGMELKDYVAARIALTILTYYPGWKAKHVTCPIFFAICGNDEVAPPGPTLHYAKQAPKGHVRLYENMGHFAIYLGEAFEKCSAEYVAFFKTNL